MLGTAPRSPKTRGVANIDHKVMILEKYESWRTPICVDFNRVVEPELWNKHKENWQDVLALLNESQVLAKKIRKLIDNATQRAL